MKNSNENNFNRNQEQAQAFEELYKKILSADGNFIEYNLPYAKREFLEYLTEKKNLLVHGSNWDTEELEPRLANCKSKKFGNLNAVYATADAVLPIFYAIKDKEKFRGMANSGFSEKKEVNRATKKVYTFGIEPEMLKSDPWSVGVVYILPKDLFEQGTDDDGVLIDEWVSRHPVKPLAKLRVTPEDFPYLKDIGVIK